MADEINWEGVSEDMSRQILQQGEIYLQAQWQAAIAADQRAVTAASIFVGIGTALAGGALAYSGDDKAIFWVGIVAATFLLLAAVCCFWSARPRMFLPPGSEPTNWIAVRKDPLAAVMGGEAQNYQDHITANNALLKENGFWFSAGAIIAVIGPVFAVIGWVIFS